MSDSRKEPGTFSALLCYWRRRRGLSQLDLSLTADVSSRHVSFLETGRSRPSEAMVLRLAGALDVPLLEQNVMLRAAGFEAVFAEPGAAALPPPVRDAIARMLAHQEPYPLTVFDRGYRLRQANQATFRVIRAVLG
jgi:transcriptional regulator with XRE-family HTH domain